MVLRCFRAFPQHPAPAYKQMQFTTLGRTGLNVSVVGLGTGGPSRLGLAKGLSAESIVRLIQYGLDQGINLIDLGATYGTDRIVADAIRKRRHEVVLSAKTILGPHIWMFEGTRTASRLSARIGEETSFVMSGGVIEKRLDASLRRLKTDHIDIFSLHSVTPGQCAPAVDRLLPALLRLKEKGKIRSVGITESFGRDPGHRVLAGAAASGSFDTIMLGLNLVNRTGSPIVAEARKNGTGVIAMYALRPFRSQASIDSLLQTSGASMAELAALLKAYGVASLQEAAMRFCRHDSGADVVLTGTGDACHLEANISAATAGPLPAPLAAELCKIFPGPELDPVK
jgi:aryl-alcohol dehydrogenase-like predicted oxidoreductase